MFEIHPSNWPVAVDINDPRDRFHRTALHEARIASERNPHCVTAPVAGIVARLQAVLIGEQTRSTEPCACPA